jgi:UDP-glucose 4-epimerase
LSTGIRLNQSVAVVTGGAGFVGSHIVDALVKEGARVRVIDNLARGGESNLFWARQHGSVEILTGDVRDPGLWDRVLKGADVVFHQAALRVSRCEENPDECWEVMVDATRALLKGCVVHRVKKIIAASSAIVYGAADHLPTPETHHLNHNITWYGTAKIVNEQMLNTFYAQKGLPGIALRYFNIYGSRMATQGHTEVLVKWFQALDQGQPIRIFGDGSQTMDWVHVKDVAQANILAAKSSMGQGVFNIGTGIETSLHQLGRLVLQCAGRHAKLELVTSQSPTNSIPRRLADISAAKKMMGYHPQVSLKTGLAEMAKWWKDAAHVS